MIEPKISLVLPFYNERGFVEQTLASLASQSCRQFELILVDNASTDGSGEICVALTRDWNGPVVTHCLENTPGKIHALITGIARVRTPLFATLDADTIYPDQYVERIIAIFAAHPDATMVMAGDIYGPPDDPDQKRRMRGIWMLSKLFPKKCHTGAFGQAFRAEAYRKAGGYDPEIWDFVLEDHELIHRVGRFGRQIYSPEHYCAPSSRRGDRSDVSWTRSESLLYTLLPSPLMDWFFYKFLARRFTARGLTNRNLRQQSWQE